MKHLSFLLALAPSLLATCNVNAAPFCVEASGLPLRCEFVDPGQCQSEATRYGGRCVANRDEFATPPGGLPYCVVESGYVATCAFPDARSCNDEAKRRSAACIVAAPPKPEPTKPDPYGLAKPDPYDLRKLDPFDLKRPY